MLYFREDSLEFCEEINDFFLNALLEKLKKGEKGIGVETAILSYSYKTVFKILDEEKRIAESKHPIHSGNGRVIPILSVPKYTENALDIVRAPHYEMEVKVFEDEILITDKAYKDRRSRYPLKDGIDFNNAIMIGFVKILYMRREKIS